MTRSAEGLPPVVSTSIIAYMAGENKIYTYPHQNILYYRTVNKNAKHLLLLLLLGVYSFASAQVIKEDTAVQRPFFAAKKFDSKFYAGFEAIPTQILKTKAAMNLGFNLNWVVNHQFVLSAKYYLLTTPLNIATRVSGATAADTIHLAHHSAGLAFSYILFYNKKFSFQPELYAGWGYIKYSYKNTDYKQHFGVIVPAVYGVYNAHKNVRIGIGLNYRFTAGATLLKNADLSGVGGVVFLRVGTF